jgi:hypothetical protein
LAFTKYICFIKKIRAYSSEFSPPVCYQPSLARIYSLLRNDPPSHSPSIRLSLFRLYFLYLARVCAKEPMRLPSVICTFFSIHPDPNHVDELCKSYPFRVPLQGMPIGISFPVYWAGHPASPPPLVHCIPGWTLPAGPSDSPSRETPCQSLSI